MGETSDPSGEIARFMAQCRAAIDECLVLDDEEDITLRLARLDVAARLMRTSLALSQALDRRRPEFTQRIIVEHLAKQTGGAAKNPENKSSRGKRAKTQEIV